MWRDLPAVVAVEVVRVVGVVLKDQRLFFDDGVTLLADILPQAAGFLTVVARPTQVPEVRRGAEPQQKSELSAITSSHENTLPACTDRSTPPRA